MGILWYRKGKVPERFMQMISGGNNNAKEFTKLHTGNDQCSGVGKTDDDGMRQEINHNPQTQKTES